VVGERPDSFVTFVPSCFRDLLNCRPPGLSDKTRTATS